MAGFNEFTNEVFGKLLQVRNNSEFPLQSLTDLADDLAMPGVVQDLLDVHGCGDMIIDALMEMKTGDRGRVLLAHDNLLLLINARLETAEEEAVDNTIIYTLVSTLYLGDRQELLKQDGIEAAFSRAGLRNEYKGLLDDAERPKCHPVRTKEAQFNS